MTSSIWTKVEHAASGERFRVVIARCAAFAEYRCRLWIDGAPVREADYHTDDLDDARSTALHMLGEAEWRAAARATRRARQ